jgi:phage terminase large subunit-like protein
MKNKPTDNEIINRAIKCGPNPVFRNWRSLPNSELTRAEKNMKFGERYLSIPEGKQVGQPIRFCLFQEAFFYSVFDNPAGTRTAILSLARKNGKTAVVATILLSFLIGPEAKANSQIASGAMSREQAGIIYSLASKMVSFSSELNNLIREIPSSKKLVGLSANTEFKALAAEGKTNQGLSLYLAIIDECGQVQGPSSDFIDAMTTSQGAHDDALTIYISTQAATDGDMLSILIDDAISSKDPRTVCHLYEADKESSLDDEKQWYYSNPALGIFRSYDDLKQNIEKAKRMPSKEASVRNLLLNQRIQRNNPFVSKSVWLQSGGDPFPLEGREVTIGLDLSMRTDLTSAVVTFTDDEGYVHVHPFFWIPSAGLHERVKRDKVPYDVWASQGLLNLCSGATIDYEVVIRDLCEVLQECHISAVSFDRWRIDIFKKDLERMGIEWPMVPHGQGFKDMSPALDALEAALLNAKMCHGNHPVLTMCAANAVETKDPAGNRKLDKSKASGRIDGMVALAMAMSHMEAEEAMDLDEFLASPVGV